MCRTYDVVLITASSGVGKTSFVRAGLIPMLEKAGAFVPNIISWPEASSVLDRAAPASGAAETAEKLYRVAIGADPDDPRPAVTVLGESVGRRAAVVVLDQFEELLRYQRGVAEHLLRIAGYTARDARIPHIVIARSEYKEDLRPIEVRGAQVWPLRLQEITADNVLRKIIEDPATTEGVDVERAASDHLIDRWKDARATTDALRAQQIGIEHLAEVGLLHFQALLWSLQQWALRAGLTERITERNVIDFTSERAAFHSSGASGDGGGKSLMDNALVHYVADQAERLAFPLEVGTRSGSRPVRWRNGPRLMLARVAPAMTAVGFKQPQSLYSLLPYAIGDEMSIDRGRLLKNLLQDRAREMASEHSEGLAHTSATIPDYLGPVGAGIAIGWERPAVAEEMITCLHAALHAMSSHEANVLREFDRFGEPVYELVHDGMGAALVAWAESFLDEPLSSVAIVAKQAGRYMGHSLSPETLGLDDDSAELWGVLTPIDDIGGRQGVAVSHLLWPASIVKGATFSDIVFRRCDFGGAAFRDCTFRRVVFQGCALTGAVMIDCTFDDVTFLPHESVMGDGDGLGLLTLDGGEPSNSDKSRDDAKDGLNLLSIVRPRREANVTFRGLRNTAGVFLEDLAGGVWRLDRSRINYLVITNAAPVVVELVASSASIARAHTATIERDDNSRVVELESI